LNLIESCLKANILFLVGVYIIGDLKYFLLGGLSSGFILLGSSLLYAYTGTLNLEDIFILYSDNLTHYFIDPCLLILFAGLLFKVSAAPFHN